MFGLVQMKITARTIALISQFVEESVFLEVLDLSWNDLIPLAFTPLLNVLENNRSLKVLNLSWNQIIDRADQNNQGHFHYKSAL